MKPYKATIFVYANDEAEVHQLEQAAYDFVNAAYNRGILVTAAKLISALSKYKNNFFVNQFLR